MAYEKLNLPDGTVINEEHLKHIEEGIANAISSSQQTWTEEQKAQARENIGAASEAYVSALIDTKLGVIENGSY